MANRIIYQSDALYASNNVRATGLDQHVQLRRVQSANYSFSVNRTDVFQFGSLARIDSTILESPTITADLSYLLGDGFNEIVLGFSDCGNPDSAPTGFVKNQIAADTEQATSGINLYVLTTPEGEDANVARSTNTEDYSTIGLGNMYVSDYTLADAQICSDLTNTCDKKTCEVDAFFSTAINDILSPSYTFDTNPTLSSFIIH